MTSGSFTMMASSGLRRRLSDSEEEAAPAGDERRKLNAFNGPAAASDDPHRALSAFNGARPESERARGRRGVRLVRLATGARRPQAR